MVKELDYETAPNERDGWKYRRRVIALSLVWIAAMVMWIIWRGGDSMLYRDASVTLILTGGAIIGSYVFGAVWDDHSKRGFHLRVSSNPSNTSDSDDDEKGSGK